MGKKKRKKKRIKIKLKKIPDWVYREILISGLKIMLNKGVSNETRDRRPRSRHTSGR